MKIKLVQDQPIPPKKSFEDFELLAVKAHQLNPVRAGQSSGDCFEVDINPEGMRPFCGGFTIVIRQISLNRWRVWRTEYA